MASPTRTRLQQPSSWLPAPGTSPKINAILEERGVFIGTREANDRGPLVSAVDPTRVGRTGEPESTTSTSIARSTGLAGRWPNWRWSSRAHAQYPGSSGRTNTERPHEPPESARRDGDGDEPLPRRRSRRHRTRRLHGSRPSFSTRTRQSDSSQAHEPVAWASTARWRDCSSLSDTTSRTWNATASTGRRPIVTDVSSAALACRPIGRVSTATTNGNCGIR